MTIRRAIVDTALCAGIMGAAILGPLAWHTATAQQLSATFSPTVTVDCAARTVTATVTAPDEPGWGFAVQGEPPIALAPGATSTITEPLSDDGGYTVVAWQQGTGIEWGGTFESDCGPVAEPEVAPPTVLGTSVTQAEPGYDPHQCDACDADNLGPGASSGFFLASQCSVAKDGTGRIQLTFTNRETQDVEATVNGSTQNIAPGAKAVFYVPFSGPEAVVTRSAQRADGRVIIAEKTRIYPCPCEDTTSTTVPTTPPTASTPPPASSVPGVPTTPPVVTSTPGTSTIIGTLPKTGPGDTVTGAIWAAGVLLIAGAVAGLGATRRSPKVER